MPSSLRSAVAWMRRRAENIVATLLGVMFVAFINFALIVEGLR